jgi:1-aminocyclopropane-1-carboxylate deaminase
MNFILSPYLQQINSEVASRAGVNLSVLRLDQIHPIINGNKWFKLKYNLLAAQEENYTTLLTFGGAYSNHIFATAAAGKLYGLHTIGVIRGEERLPLNPTLSFAVEQGMELVYLNRQTYRQRHTKELLEDLQYRFGQVFIIPEGGSNLNGVRGCIEIAQAATTFNTVCLPCGTGTTLAGIVLGLLSTQRAIAFPVLKNGAFLAQEINTLLTNYLQSGLPVPHSSPAPWELVCDYHFGGYAKVTRELLHFTEEFRQTQGIPLDHVYTAKMFYGVIDLLQQGFFPRGDRLLLVHTGGLQNSSLGISDGQTSMLG